jgi:hypothetical protein
MSTWAKDHLEQLQAIHPPWRSVDRAKLHYQTLSPYLPSVLLSAQLSIGEVGLADPAADMLPKDDESFLILLNSGLMEFFYTMSRTLCGLQRTYSPGGVEEPSLTYDQLVRAVSTLYGDWKAGKYTRGEEFVHPLFPLDQEGTATAEHLASCAELFVLAHELGHVAIRLGNSPPFESDPWGGEESHADAFAARIVLVASQRMNARMLYAGAVFAIRVFFGLTQVGFQFAHHYPPAAVRLNMLATSARLLLGNDEAKFLSLNTIAAGFDELLEGAENLLFGRGPTTRQTTDRVLTRLWSMLEAAANGSVPMDKLVRDASASFTTVSDEVMAEAAQKISGLLPAGSGVGPGPTGKQLRMGESLRKLAPQLPEPARSAFTAALKL